jgi:hypothetical protein
LDGRAAIQAPAMEHWRAPVAILALCLAPLLSAAQTPESTAEAAALAWLKLVDSADYDNSWDAAAPVFRQAITKVQWAAAAAAARTPFGRLKSRNLQSATYTRSLPGAADGEYVVIKFASKFENRAAAIETITPMHDADGAWRVAGYYIR